MTAPTPDPMVCDIPPGAVTWLPNGRDVTCGICPWLPGGDRPAAVRWLRVHNVLTWWEPSVQNVSVAFDEVGLCQRHADHITARTAEL